MKRLFLLPILLCVCVLQSFAAQYTDTNGVTWTFNFDGGNGSCTVTGAENYGDNVVIPDFMYNGTTGYEVKTIGSNLFQGNLTLTTVALPTSVKTIKGYAFYGCQSLTTVTGTENCERIEGYAFQNCSNLTQIDLSSCKYIYHEAFNGCTNLTSIVSLAACETIYFSAFRSCGALQSINLGDNVSIENSAFYWCTSLTNVGSLKGASIGEYAFGACQSLTTVDISQAASVGNYAFSGCTNLTTAGDLSAYTAIGDNVFNGCQKLAAVDLSNCQFIGNGAFSGCSSLTALTLPKVKTIGDNAFSGCSLLNDPNITSTELTSIGNYAFNTPGTLTLTSATPATLASNNAFGSLMVIRVPDAALATYRAADKWSDFKARIVSINTQLTYNVNLTAKNDKSALIEEIGEANVGQVVTLKISGTINSYDIMALRNKMDNLHYLDLSDANIVACDYQYYTGYHTTDNVLGAKSFCELTKLLTVKLPKTITKIGNQAFYACYNLKEVEFQTGIESIGDEAFQGCGNLKTVELKDGLKSIGYAAFSGSGFYIAGEYQSGRAPKFEEIILPEGLETIGSYAFHENRNLRLIAFPSTLKSIGSQAFLGCSQLTNISLPTSLQRIEWETFRGCSSLTEAHIPSSITSIGDKAFFGCSKLNDVFTYIVEPTQIDMNTFSTYMTATLHVPTTSFYNYYYDTEWSQFRNLEELFGAEYKYFYINNDFTINNDKGTVQGEGEDAPDVDLNPGSGLIVETEGEGNNQELDEVHIKADGDEVGSIIANDNLTAEKLYFDIKINAGRWYFFSFPFRVKVTNITAPGQYVFRYYSGEKRATGITGWLNWLQDWLLPGQGYIFQCNKSGTLTLAVEKEDMNWKADNRPREFEQHPSDNHQDASWNFMGNPHTSYYDIQETGYTQPVTIWNGTSYEAVRPGDDDYYLRPFEAFFVQKPDNQNTMDFPANGRYTYNQVNERQHNHAPALRAKGVDTERMLINLEMTDGKTVDKTRVVYNEQASKDYEIACDASKFMSAERMPQFYSIDNQIRYAINERPMGEVNIGYMTYDKGELTITATRMDQPVFLRDNLLKTTHDLSQGGYTFSTEAGTWNDRFTLTIDQSTTSIAQLRKDTGISVLPEQGGISFMGTDGHEVEVYSVAGVCLAANVSDGFLALPIGTYIVKVGQTTSKVIVR